MPKKTSQLTESISTTTGAVIITGCVVLVIAGLIAAYHFGRIEGARPQTKTNVTGEVIDKNAKNWDINHHIWDAYKQGCLHGIESVSASLGWDTAPVRAELETACDGGSKSLPFYNL